jgi:hypothetical protein
MAAGPAPYYRGAQGSGTSRAPHPARRITWKYDLEIVIKPGRMRNLHDEDRMTHAADIHAFIRER